MFYPLGGGQMAGGTEGLVQVKTKTPVVAGPGDHFLLRTSSPVRTIGGGLIVETLPERVRAKASRPEVLADLQERCDAVVDPRHLVAYCIRRADGLAVTETALAVRTKIPQGRLQQLLAELAQQGAILPLATRLWIHRDTAAEAQERIVALVRDFHRQSPESPGLPLEQLRQSTPGDKAVFDGLLARLKTSGRLVDRGGRLALAEHHSTFSDEDEKLLHAIESLFRQRLFSPPSTEELARHCGIESQRLAKLLDLLRQHGRLVRVEPGLLFHREAVDRARDVLIEHIRAKGRLESVDFKYLLDTTRKYAIPLLDHLDRAGATRRVGNTRFLK